MSNKENIIEVDNSDSYSNQIDIWYRANNIHKEKITLFHDFLISLQELVEKTYLGVDVCYLSGDQYNHYKWCWNKTIESFEKERIYFKSEGLHFDFFWGFFHEAFYMAVNDGTEIKIENYINKIFDFTIKKTKDELDVVSQFYKLLEQNLKK